MYEITIMRSFTASHALKMHDGSFEHPHTHEWSVEVTAASPELDSAEMVQDFHVLEKVVDKALEHMRNTHLNAIAPFAAEDGSLAINPTAERVAWHIAQQLSPVLEGLVSVKIGEEAGCWATYRR